MKKITLLFALLITSLGYSQNLVSNGDFETGDTTGWSGDAAYVVTDGDNSYNSADVTTAGNPYDVNLSQVLSITSGQTYTLRFDAWSDRDRTLIAGIGLNESPWTNTIETVNLTSSSQSYVLTLTANFGLANSRVLFDMGAAVGFVGIDNVSLVENVAPPAGTPEVLQDFEDGGLGEAFAGALGSIVADPETGGSRGDVAMLTASSSGAVYQGINIVLNKNVQLTSSKTMEIDVYSDAAITFAPKVLGGLESAPASTSSATHTGSGWETLTVTFDKGYDNTVPANGVYSQFVIYYNWDATASNFLDPAVDRVFYVDNISGIGAVAPPVATPPSAAPVPPARNAWDVISLYSDSYTQTAITQFDAGWCGPNSVSEVQVDGNSTLAWLSNPCQGITFPAVDASAFTNMHVDLYIEAGTDLTSKVFNLKFVDTANNIFLEVNNNIASNPPLVAGSWVSIDVPVNLSTFTTLNEFGVTSGNLNNIAWYDNLYFYRAATASVDKNNLLNVSLSPSPAANDLRISAQSIIENVTIYNILGKTVLNAKINKKEDMINVSSLDTGVYILKYTINNAVGTMKFVKE
ncbi:carbohydrate binding domain-containing protein [Polaribacter sp. HL-MS24]|uniref:carbohydrate binding domain-containing protein n=1 Tax=Polaribacter sp. HL-MS24 TaxID=3077735 RepID=UPI0029341AFC|nr:carbohydrate binding domain-containing protein [Polaribacter sp. HL-MS24]WOC40406.1 carbohydrate binding domain-containing protein [Polaribacter sp. HL-MS24]